MLQIALYQAVAAEGKKMHWCYFGLYSELCLQALVHLHQFNGMRVQDFCLPLGHGQVHVVAMVWEGLNAVKTSCVRHHKPCHHHHQRSLHPGMSYPPHFT